MEDGTSRGLKGMKALVTGASGGIGKAVALLLAARGAEVVVHGRDPQRAAEVVDAIKVADGRARFVAADLSDPAQVARLAEEAGEVDILVNNAGAAAFGPSTGVGVAQFDALFASNVRAPFLLVALIAPRMAKRGRGSIVNIGSMAGTIGLSGGAVYGATKAAISSMTRAWAAEFSASGVRVNTVAPGPVHGTVSSNQDVIEALGATTAMKRSASPTEIAEVVAFLASPAASYITGATVAADGGRTAI